MQIGKGQGEGGRLAQQDHDQRANDPATQNGIVCRPQVGKETLERLPSIVAGVGGVGGCIWWHRSHIGRLARGASALTSERIEASRARWQIKQDSARGKIYRNALEQAQLVHAHQQSGAFYQAKTVERR